MTSIHRRKLLQLLGATCGAPLHTAAPGFAHAKWPERIVRVVSIYGAGGSNALSTTGRAQGLSALPEASSNAPWANNLLAVGVGETPRGPGVTAFEMPVLWCGSAPKDRRHVLEVV